MWFNVTCPHPVFFVFSFCISFWFVFVFDHNNELSKSWPNLWGWTLPARGLTSHFLSPEADNPLLVPAAIITLQFCFFVFLFLIVFVFVFSFSIVICICVGEFWFIFLFAFCVNLSNLFTFSARGRAKWCRVVVGVDASESVNLDYNNDHKPSSSWMIIIIMVVCIPYYSEQGAAGDASNKGEMSPWALTLLAPDTKCNFQSQFCATFWAIFCNFLSQYFAIFGYSSFSIS